MRYRVLLIVLASVPSLSYGCADLDPDTNAHWMSGNWGIRLVLPGGNSKSVHDFDVGKLINQIKSLKTISWVMINLNAGSIGGRFTAPLPEEKYFVDERMAPKRDLFNEVITELKKNKLKVLVYVTAQGPLSENVTHWAPPKGNAVRPREMVLEIRSKWMELATKQNKSGKELWAELLASYSKKYALGIDGWWFDYGQWGDAESLTASVKLGNPDAVVGWNQNHGNSDNWIYKVNKKGVMRKWVLARSHQWEDYTGGHPSPPEVHPPWWKGNYEMVEQVKHSCSIDGALAHVFMPMQENWRAGEAGFSIHTLYAWTAEITQSGGAITWAVALKTPEFKHAEFEARQFKQLREIDMKLQNIN
ncbi:MAG: hypothetical protein KJO81_02145 [Gammaproteobacteria bacterium]|nr:hypothetical protein [Gammaproteobacteria bacterium]